MKPLSLLVAVLFLCTPAHATDWIVNPGDSIQAAIDAAASGDRVLVQPGTYNEVLQDGFLDTFDGKSLELIGVGGPAVTILDGAGLTESLFTVHSTSTPIDVRIAGLTMTHGYGSLAPAGNTYGGAILASGSVHLIVEDCRIVDNGRSNLYFAGGVYARRVNARVDLVGCLLARNESRYSGGATLSDYDALITLDRCTVAGNVSSTSFGRQAGLALANGGDVIVTSSILWGQLGDPIADFGGASSQGNTVTVSYSDVQGGDVGPGVVDVDPLYVDLSRGEYLLAPCSPCIDAGDPAGDLDPDGTVADQGYAPFSQVPPTFAVTGIGSTLSYDPGPVDVTGSGLDLVTDVAVNGAAATIVSQSPDLLTIDPDPTDPGFGRLALFEGDAGACETIELLPSNLSTTTGVGGTLDVELENGEPGIYSLGAGLTLLSSPFTLQAPPTAYVLLLDLGPDFVFLETGVFADGSPLLRSFPVPNDPALAGLDLHVQAWTRADRSDGSFARSFTNLETVTL